MFVTFKLQSKTLGGFCLQKASQLQKEYHWHYRLPSHLTRTLQQLSVREIFWKNYCSAKTTLTLGATWQSRLGRVLNIWVRVLENQYSSTMFSAGLGFFRKKCISSRTPGRNWKIAISSSFFRKKLDEMEETKISKNAKNLLGVKHNIYTHFSLYKRWYQFIYWFHISISTSAKCKRCSYQWVMSIARLTFCNSILSYYNQYSMIKQVYRFKSSCHIFCTKLQFVFGNKFNCIMW